MRQTRFLDRTSPPHIATLILICGLGALSLNIYSPSLPSMAKHFGVDYALMQLTVSLYLAMTAVIQIVIGPISDRFGRRPVLLAAVVIFTVATLVALFAPNYETFVVARMVQSVIASAFALSRAVVRDVVPADQAASWIGYVTMGMSLVPMVGPAVGGMLDKAFGWQSTFWLLAGGGVLLFVLLWRDLGETAPKGTGRFIDQVRAWPSLLKSQRFWGYCLAAAFASGAFFAFLGGAPYVGSTLYGMDAATLGAYFAAPSIGYMAGNYFSGRYSVRLGLNRMVMLGALVGSAGMAAMVLLDLAGQMGAAAFFGLMIPVGLGNGILLPSANAGMLSVRPELAGSAAGLGGAITIAGGAALAALAGWLLEGGSATPLVWVMFVTSVLGVVSAQWVIVRARAVMRAG
jgi:MFS transporter, DHA1 family, multidrug resistance protein